MGLARGTGTGRFCRGLGYGVVDRDAGGCRDAVER